MSRVVWFILILCRLFRSTKCGMSDILDTCIDDCLDKNPYPSFESSVFKSSLYSYASSGVPKILFDLIRSDSSIITLCGVSHSCIRDLKRVISGVDQGLSWAYDFLDSSAKSSSGASDGTLSSLGNFDLCLRSQSLDDPGFTGKYCLTEMFPILRRNKSHGGHQDDFVDMGTETAAQGLPFSTGLCYPSTCSEGDVKRIMNAGLQTYRLKVNGFITCDTQETISWLYRLKHLTIHQKISGCIISCVILWVMFNTIYFEVGKHFLSLEALDPKRGRVLLNPQFSIVSSWLGLFEVTDPESETLQRTYIDWYKMISITTGTLSHIPTCLEIPISYYMIDRHRDVLRSFGTMRAALLNEHGLAALSALSGFGTLAVVWPMAHKLTVFGALLDRWLKYIPSVVCLTCLEFLWPLFSSGPFWTRVAQFNHEKCHKNYWLNLLFINNWISAVDICSGHTYYSSIDMQLFTIGLITISIMIRWRKLGIVMCLLMITLSNTQMLRNAFVHNVPSSLIIPNPTPEGIIAYLDYIHMNICSYTAPFFLGFLTAYAIFVEGVRLRLNRTSDHIIWHTLFWSIWIAANVLKGLQGNLKVIHDGWGPWVILINRTSYSVISCILFFYVCSLAPHKIDFTYHAESFKEVAKKKYYYSVRGLSRVTYSVYMSNYLLIRSAFFSRTSLYSFSDTLPLLQHLISMYLMIVILAFFFHAFFVSPFEVIKRSLFDKKRHFKRDEKNE